MWREARHDEAIAALRSFEEAGGTCALGIAWEPGLGPVSRLGAAATSGGTDVRIGGARINGRQTSLDFDAGTGNLFCVVRWGGPPARPAGR